MATYVKGPNKHDRSFVCVNQTRRENHTNKVPVGNVDEAILRGVSGVSCQVNLGSKKEAKMLQRMVQITSAVFVKNTLILGMLYVRGENVNIMKDDVMKGYAHAARIGFELGCDVVKPCGLETRIVFQNLPICPHSSVGCRWPFDRR